ncbi:MAG: hypothetical protein KC501_31175 [Myxococcales bacterium]|nr:hypothetical protein [Myxococcales bacterium]
MEPETHLAHTAAAEPSAEDSADGAPAAAEPAEPAEPPKPAWMPRAEDEVTPHMALEHPERLAAFFERLAAIDDGAKEVVRVVHLGSSMIGADDLPGIMRTKFQTRFGDGGAGLVLLARYMPNYLHQWVKLQADGWEHCYIAYLCKGDGHYGLGGTTFWSGGGAHTTIQTRDHELGGSVSKYEVWYVADKGGGRLRVRVDGGEPEVISTRAEQLEDRYHPIDVEPGPHKIKLEAVGGGRVRGYGVVLETDGPGITWEQFSMLGAFTRRMLGWDPDHIAGQIEHRNPDLIVFTYGGNDTRRVANGKLTAEQYIGEYVEAIGRVRAGKPGVPCLITAMTDRAKSLEFKITAEHTQLIATAQKEVADQAGCAFFDSYHAMGGAGSLMEWRAMDPPLASGDLKHLNHRGRVRLGGWIYDAIITAYVEHRKQTNG